VREIEATARVELPPGADAMARLNAFEQLLLEAPGRMLPRLLGIMAPAMLSLGLAAWMLRGKARADEVQLVIG
jgi:hypothetical protein